MKKLFLFLFPIFLVIIVSKSSFALSPTPTKKLTPTPQITEESREIDRIEKIKDLVASKVAELKLVDKRGIVGAVKSSTNTQITIEDHKEATRIVDIDELTKFEGNDKESFGISDIKKGDALSFIGLYNKDSKRLLARFISRAPNIPINIEGVVIKKDKEQFLLTVAVALGQKKTISVETSTKSISYDKGETKKSGFSKIEVGQRLIIVGFEDTKVKDRINASRIVNFPSLPLSSEMKKISVFTGDEVQESTGSAGKVKPIIKE